LNHAEDGKYRDKFHDWLRAELEKRSSGQYFDSLFGLDSDEKWNAFELEFRNYVVQALRKDSKDYKDRNDTVNVKYRTDFERACEEGARKAAEGTAAQPESKK
jgi:hypothetical protein